VTVAKGQFGHPEKEKPAPLEQLPDDWLRQ
jgi:hypothetical protein